MRLIALLAAFLCLALPALAEAAFPGANGKLALEQFDPPSNQEIYTINPDGTGLANVSNDPTVDSVPAWSPDGSEIAFEAERDGNDEIYTMNADGTGQANVTDHPEFDKWPAWSPDGNRIVFASTRDGDFELYSINADGTGLVQLTHNDTMDFDPAWSPDGTRIAFVTDRHFDYEHFDFNYEIYTMNADGSGETRLTVNTSPDDSPDWAPDGTRIVFAGGRRVGAGEIVIDIKTMNPDGTGEALVTGMPGSGQPAWSPDGSRIVFVAQSPTSNESDLYTINPDRSGLVNVTNTPATNERSPDWQPIPVTPPGPQPGDYKNASHFCKAQREFLGDAAFRQKHGGGANAHGKCVSGKRS